MRALIVVGCIDTWSDESVADIKAAAQAGFYVRAIMRIYVDCIVKTVCFCKFGQLCYQIIVVRSTGILCTDGYHALGTTQIITDTAHIHADHFFGICRDGTSTVSDFLINSK